jgi:hypothetical protein
MRRPVVYDIRRDDFPKTIKLTIIRFWRFCRQAGLEVALFAC